MEINGKVTVITGASAGIGRITAQRFAAAGAKLVLAARSGDKLGSLADEFSRQGTEAWTRVTDMRHPEEVTALMEGAFARFGRIDILINNAGQSARGTIAAVSLADYRSIIDLNLFGPLAAMQAVIPKMRQQGGGLIINISSMVSKMHLPSLGAYASTKSALNMLSDTAREELASDNIRVITVYPRLTATDFAKNSLGATTGFRSSAPYPADPPELVADKILTAAQQEPQEQFMDK